jgi:hypothetical protein
MYSKRRRPAVPILSTLTRRWCICRKCVQYMGTAAEDSRWGRPIMPGRRTAAAGTPAPGPAGARRCKVRLWCLRAGGPRRTALFFSQPASADLGDASQTCSLLCERTEGTSSGARRRCGRVHHSSGHPRAVLLLTGFEPQRSPEVAANLAAMRDAVDRSPEVQSCPGSNRWGQDDDDETRRKGRSRSVTVRPRPDPGPAEASAEGRTAPPVEAGRTPWRVSCAVWRASAGAKRKPRLPGPTAGLVLVLGWTYSTSAATERAAG